MLIRVTINPSHCKYMYITQNKGVIQITLQQWAGMQRNNKSRWSPPLQVPQVIYHGISYNYSRQVSSLVWDLAIYIVKSSFDLDMDLRMIRASHKLLRMLNGNTASISGDVAPHFQQLSSLWCKILRSVHRWKKYIDENLKSKSVNTCYAIRFSITVLRLKYSRTLMSWCDNLYN